MLHPSLTEKEMLGEIISVKYQKRSSRKDDFTAKEYVFTRTRELFPSRRQIPALQTARSGLSRLDSRDCPQEAAGPSSEYFN